MNRVLLTLATFISTTFLISASFAGSATEECLQVNVLNKTNYTCNRKDFALKHGSWTDGKTPPIAIHPQRGEYWTACQTEFYGPNVTATYECNGYFFSVKNQQNLLFVKAGNQHCRVYNIDKHLNVTNKQTQHANEVSHKIGIAQVIISLKKSP